MNKILHSKFFMSFTALLACSFAAFAQSNVSNQIHEDKVAAVAFCETNDSPSKDYFSVDESGTVIKWSTDGFGEHLQISNLKIKMVAKNNTSDIIAVYETDGYKQNRVSVVDWTNNKRLYSIYYKDTVSAINFSEAGTYLMVTTFSAGGGYIYNAKDGSLIKQLDDVPGMISMIKTGASEKTAIFYSNTGYIVYYDIVNMKQKVRRSTEKLLTQAMLCANNSYLVGVKDNIIYFIDATSGKTLSTYTQAVKPFLASSNVKGEEGLYFITAAAKGYNIRLVTNDTLTKLNKGEIKTITTTLIKSFTGLGVKETITAAGKSIDSFVIGTNQGNVYCTSAEYSETASAVTETLKPLTKKIYEKIYDAASAGDDFYILTSAGVFKSSFDEKKVDKISISNGHTNLIKYENNLILWSKNTRKTVQMLDLENPGSGLRTLFTPAGNIQSIHSYGTKLVYSYGRTNVNTYDVKTKGIVSVYTSNGIEDAIMINDNYLYVAKAKTGQTDSALMLINRKTRETIPLKVGGDLALSINYDFDNPDKFIYGILITNNDSYSTTEVFAYDIEQRGVRHLYSINEEDTNAFAVLNGNTLYYNVGKDSVKGINLLNFKNTVFRRSPSIPVKLTTTQDRLLVLNSDGSLTWYNKDSQAVLGEWRLKVDGSWYEF